MSDPAPYTAEQLREGVAKAIAARDFQAAIDILHALVAIDPTLGMEVYDDIQAGLRVAGSLR